jgi:hypothetical protein
MIKMPFMERVVFADNTDSHRFPPLVMIWILYKERKRKSNRNFERKGWKRENQVG